ncbi:MAG: LysR family transcriptional regulator [Deltaproteobacteria bacterium]
MNSDPDWTLYRTFLAVLDEGSLSGAARLLGTTQPTVSRQIDTLEAQLGRVLFLRTQRGLIPNDLALELRPHAATLAATAAALLRQASGARDGVSGTVRISASEVIAVEVLPAILAALHLHYPDLVLELVATDRVEDLLQQDADIAVRNVAPVQTALVSRKLAPAMLGLHASRDYLERRGMPATLDDLARHSLVGFDHETPAIRALLQRYPTLGHAAFALRTGSNLAQLAAIRAGFGIGFCQCGLAARDPALVRVLTREVDIELGMFVVMHEDQRHSARCRVVFDALVDGLSAAV